MNPKDRTKRYAQLAALAAVLVWAMLCYFIVLSPKLARLNRVNGELARSSKQLSEMRKEIENASIAGPPVVGASRFEKFGILASDEEQLFLSDLIGFCKETSNTLNLVRRADVARPAATSAEQTQKGGAASKAPKPSEPGSQVPQPIIERVPHNVNYSGTFLSSFYLLQKLESYKRLLTVERMEVDTDNQLGYPRVTGTITVDLFLVKNLPSPPVTPGGGAAGELRPAGEPRPAGGQPAPSA